jgi:hypothetical protein
MAACHYHPDRTGIGICMRCRAVICAACCTRVDGVNHCHACLKAMGRREEPRAAPLAPAALVTVLFLGLAWGLFFALAWAAQGRLAP